MFKLSENRKKGLVVILFIAFTWTAYLTFFSKKAHDPVTGQTPDALVVTQTRDDAANLSPLKDLLADITLSTQPAIQFKPNIRDMFALPKKFRHPIIKKLTDNEKASIRDALLLTGVITHGKRSVAIINGNFFHINDFVTGYRIVSISNNQVTIDTQRGVMNIGMMKNDLF